MGLVEEVNVIVDNYHLLYEKYKMLGCSITQLKEQLVLLECEQVDVSIALNENRDAERELIARIKSEAPGLYNDISDIVINRFKNS